MMTDAQILFDKLASLLEYPSEELGEQLSAYEELIGTECPSAVEAFGSFRRHTESTPLGEMQELFTRTFDHNPRTCLEVGWHLFGENYSRGAFLVEMREILRHLKIPEGAELPDHLSYALLVIGRMPHDDAAEFVTRRILPAVERLTEGLKSKGSYAHLIEALRLVLTEKFGAIVRTGVPLPIVQDHDSMMSLEEGKNG